MTAHVPIDDAFLYAAFDVAPDAMLAFLARRVGAGPFRILDAGCGVGRMLRPLSDMGWDVIGLEPNPAFAAAARRHAPGVVVRNAGLEDIDDDGAFDLVLIANDPLQYVLTASGREEALRRIHRALRPGGRLLLDLANFAFILANRRAPRALDAVRDGVRVSCRVAHDLDARARVWTHTSVFDVTWPDGRHERASQVHRLSIAPWPELRAEIERSGFVSIETWPAPGADLPGEPQGPRILATAWKPPAAP